MPQPQTIHQPLSFSQLPEPILYLERSMPSETIYPPHRHAWGEFVYSFSGVLELNSADRWFRVPPSYALWLPPGSEHHGRNRHASDHCSLYIEPGLSAGLPPEPCALMMTPLIRELLHHLKAEPPTPPYKPAQHRLLQVVLDLLQQARSTGSYLPYSTDPLLSQVLDYFERDPGSECPIRQLAESLGTTERTLARKAKQDLGISLAQWRQRMKVVRAMPLLESGEKVETIALELGYSTASAFISMFRKRMGQTPDEYRRAVSGSGVKPS